MTPILQALSLQLLLKLAAKFLILTEEFKNHNYMNDLQMQFFTDVFLRNEHISLVEPKN